MKLTTVDCKSTQTQTAGTGITSGGDTVVHFVKPRSRSPHSAKSCPAMFPPPRKLLRLVFIAILLAGVSTIYITLFQHPPPDQLLEMNRRGARSFDTEQFIDADSVDTKGEGGTDAKEEALTNDEDEEDEDVDDDTPLSLEDDDIDMSPKMRRDTREKEEEEREKGKEKEVKRKVKGRGMKVIKGKAEWDKFIKDNSYTAIGVVFDRCENPREQLGTVILLPDEEFGGVKSRTFYNFTLDYELEEGTFSIEVTYNGQDLYSNWWEVCEMEEDLEPEKKTFTCPIRRGEKHFVKDKHIPGYLPKGRYKSKAWFKNAKGELLVCGFSDFLL